MTARRPKLDQLDNAGIVDLFVIGVGINGCGIARDAAGRVLSVELAEMNDLASATSSALETFPNTARSSLAAFSLS